MVADDATLNFTVKRKSKKKIGFEVELNDDDGHYYLTKVPPGHRQSAVGDRVLQINGTPSEEFKDEKHANELFDTFRLEVVPHEETEDDDEEEEEEDVGDRGNRMTRGRNVPAKQHAPLAEESDSEPEPEPEPEPAPKRKTDKYVPNDRFMITVSREDDSEDNGIDLVEYNGEFYVAAIHEDGPFYTTAIDIADKILSINGKKVAKDIKDLDQGLALMNSKAKITLFVMRLEPKDSGYQWVIENYGEEMEEVSDEEDLD